MVEVRTEKSKEVLPILITKKQKYTATIGIRLAGQIGNWVTRQQKNECDPPCRRRRKTKENH